MLGESSYLSCSVLNHKVEVMVPHRHTLHHMTPLTFPGAEESQTSEAASKALPPGAVTKCPPEVTVTPGPVNSSRHITEDFLGSTYEVPDIFLQGFFFFFSCLFSK